MENLFFTMRIEPETRERLESLAKLHRRSMAAQIAFWIDREWEKSNNQPEPAFIHNLDVAEYPPAE